MVKTFLEHWGIVVVSLDEYEGSAESFGSITATVPSQTQEIIVVLKGDSLEDALSFLYSLELFPISINFLDIQRVLPDVQVAQLLKKVLSEHEEASHVWAAQQQQLQQKEQKRYENKNIKEALKVINHTVDRVSQILLIGKGMLSSDEIRTLNSFSEDLKKIRLGTNFNKMVMLLLETQHHLQKAEDKVLKALDDKKFLIDRNSIVTNIDVISESNALLIAQEKYLLKQQLTVQESLYLSGKYATIFAKFFNKDLAAQFTSLDLLIPNLVAMLEYFCLVSLLLFSFVSLFAPAFGGSSPLVSFLPALGITGGLSYIYTLLPLRERGVPVQVFCLLIFAVIAYFGITLLTASFAF